MATAIKRTDGGLSFGPFKLLVKEERSPRAALNE